MKICLGDRCGATDFGYLYRCRTLHHRQHDRRTGDRLGHRRRQENIQLRRLGLQRRRMRRIVDADIVGGELPEAFLTLETERHGLCRFAESDEGKFHVEAPTAPG